MQEEGCFRAEIEYQVNNAHIVSEPETVGAQLVIFDRLKTDCLASSEITVDCFDRRSVAELVVYAENITHNCVAAAVEQSDRNSTVAIVCVEYTRKTVDVIFKKRSSSVSRFNLEVMLECKDKKL